MKSFCCARCESSARFAVSAGDPDTFWYRSEAACVTCLPSSRRWAEFVGPATVVTLDQAEGPAQIPLFELDRAGFLILEAGP